MTQMIVGFQFEVNLPLVYNRNVIAVSTRSLEFYILVTIDIVSFAVNEINFQPENEDQWLI